MQQVDDKKKFTKLTIIILLLLLIVGVITSNHYKEENRKRILIEKDFTKGQIVKFFTDRYSTKMVYVFYYKNKYYRSTIGTNILKPTEKKLLNTRWPVILSMKSPDLNRILISVEDFKHYNLQRPDTLLKIEEIDYF